MTGDESEALRNLRDGDIAGLETLVRLYQRQATAVAFHITRDLQLAEDIAADSFLAAYDHIHQYDMNRPFGPWFYRIVVNDALKAVSRGTRARGGEDLYLIHNPDPAASPEEAVLHSEERHAVIAAIGRLPAKQRATLTLRYYLDMDEGAIARTLGVPRGTVKWRLHAARRQLRLTLADLRRHTPARTQGEAR